MSWERRLHLAQCKSYRTSDANSHEEHGVDTWSLQFLMYLRTNKSAVAWQGGSKMLPNVGSTNEACRNAKCAQHNDQTLGTSSLKTSTAFSVGRCRLKNTPRAQPCACQKFHSWCPRIPCRILPSFWWADPTTQPHLAFLCIIRIQVDARECCEDLCLQSTMTSKNRHFKLFTDFLLWAWLCLSGFTGCLRQV